VACLLLFETTISHTFRAVIVMGSILGCQNAALAMAAGISAGRSPLLRIEKPWRHRNAEVSEREMIEDDRIDRILKERAKISKRVGKSDHAFLAEMFMGWKSSSERKKFCDSLGLSFTGMQDMMQLHNQLEASLATAGFVATKQSERNSTSWRIIHSCAVTAMAPGQLVKIRRPPEKYHDTAEGAVKKSGEAKELKFFIRVDADESSTTATPDHSSKTSHQEERVFIHPSSVNFTQGDYSFPFLVYNSLVRTSKPFLRDATECNAYAMLLFGGPLELQASKDAIVIDSWASLSANARIGVLIKGLRRRLDKLLEEKIRSPDLDIASAPEMDIIAKLISTDGFGVSTKSPSR
jgi:ATP-dependent RNA helicase DHX57